MYEPDIVFPSNYLKMIQELLRLGIFSDVDGHQINSSKGVINFGCSDGDQFDDAYSHQKKMSDNNRIHPLNLNGGALLLAPDSPAFRFSEFYQDRDVLSKFLRKQIYVAQERKGINTVTLGIHSPCAIAIACKIDPIEATNLIMEAKTIIKAESLEYGKELKVSCFHHLDHARCGTGKNKKRTHFISRKKWEENYKEAMKIRKSLL